MRGARRAQQATVRLKVEVELDGVHDVAIDDRARWAVSALVACSVSGEEADMVTLSDDDDSDGGSNAKLLACLCRNCTWLVDRRVWPPVAHTLDTRKLCKKKRYWLVVRGAHAGQVDAPMSRTCLNCPSDTPSGQNEYRYMRSQLGVHTSEEDDPLGISI